MFTLEAALFVGKMFLTTMGEHVSLQGASFCTFVAALIAAEWLFATVGKHAHL